PTSWRDCPRPAASSRCGRTSPGCLNPRSPVESRLHRRRVAAMTFDTTAFVRLEALQMFDKSASGTSFTTSTGDILEVSCYGPGVFRMRVGPSTLPDYGLVVGRAKACKVEHGE